MFVHDSAGKARRRALGAVAVCTLAACVSSGPLVRAAAGADANPSKKETAKVEQTEQDLAAVRQASRDYIAAFNAGDAKALLAAWTEDGQFVDERGRSVAARPMLERKFSGRTADVVGPQLSIHIDHIHLATPDVAVDDGLSEMHFPDGTSQRGDNTAQRGDNTVERGRYTAVWVRGKGSWLLSSVRDTSLNQHEENQHLAELDWMVGQWVGQSDDLLVHVSCHWNGRKTFLLREVTVSRAGHPFHSITQRIGWDPVNKQIRSWQFDADGGYGEGTWTQTHGMWLVEITGVHHDGKQVSATSILSHIEDDAYVQETIDAKADGQRGRDLRVHFTRTPLVE